MHHALRATHMINLVDVHRHIFHNGSIEGLETDPSIKLTTLSMPVAGIRADAAAALQSDCSPKNIGVIRSLIGRCNELDDKLTYWQTALPLVWREFILKSKDIPQAFSKPHLICPGIHQIRVYRDLHTAELHCRYHILRAMLLSVMLRCHAYIDGNSLHMLDYVTQDQPPHYAQIKQLLLDSFSAVCSCVPFFLGITPSIISRDHHEPTTYQVSPLGLIQVVGPLYVARSIFFSSAEQRRWIDSILCHIGHELELKVPGLVAGLSDFGPLFPEMKS